MRKKKQDPSIYILFRVGDIHLQLERWGTRGKVESVSEETRNVLGMKERIIEQGLKAGIYCTSGNASELESI